MLTVAPTRTRKIPAPINHFPKEWKSISVYYRGFLGRLEERILRRSRRGFLAEIGRDREVEVAIGVFGGDAATGGAGDEAALDQERLVHIRDRIDVFGERDGEGVYAHRPAA